MLKPMKFDNERKDLIHCELCKITSLWNEAVKKHWVRDDRNLYCPECEKEMMKALDVPHGL